jgi:hypothetical protein
MNPTEYLDMKEPNTRLCKTCHTRKSKATIGADGECRYCENARPRVTPALAELEAYRDSLPPLPDPLRVAHNAYQRARYRGQAAPLWAREGESKYRLARLSSLSS